MPDRTPRIAQVPDFSEVVLMVVEAHARRRVFDRAYRDQQLEFQCLLDLAQCHELAAAPKERVAGLFDGTRQSQLSGEVRCPGQPAATEGVDLLWRAEANVFAHAERLEPVEVFRRLTPKAVGGDVELKASGRHRAAARGDRVDRVT